MVIELRVVQFWSEIILVISNQTRAARSFDFEITRMISDQIALHSVQLPILIFQVTVSRSMLERHSGYYPCRYGDESRFRLFGFLPFCFLFRFFFFCFVFASLYCMAGYEVTHALPREIHCFAFVLRGKAIHFRFYAKVLLTVCPSVCPDCGFVKERSKRMIQIIFFIILLYNTFLTFTILTIQYNINMPIEDYVRN